MSLDLTNAVVYDVETFPNVFTLAMEMLNFPVSAVWEISEFRDDRAFLFQWFEYCRSNQVPMIGFFSLQFDYPIIHYIMKHPNCTVADIYAKSQELSSHFDNFTNIIWQSDRFAPQIDLFKINHFDNRAKTTSLKALQINMRSHTVVDMPVPFGTQLNPDQTNCLLIPYNKHDTSETKQFAHNCMSAINFRIGLIGTLNGDVLNFSDVKIGAKTLEQRIGENICYKKEWIDTGFNGEGYSKKQPRQTYRSRIALRDIIFPYIRFSDPEFARVLAWMKAQVLTPEDLNDPDAPVKTKGVFKEVVANVGGIEFHFGTGGMHASVKPQRIIATDEWLIEDIDVGAFYPNIAIANKLAPEHLGEAYTREYAKLPIERKEWQKKKGKKCVEANSLKLAANGPWGQSNNIFTSFYDPQYAMTIPINGQLLLCMLAEWLLTVPTVQIIQANTDGITYRINREFKAHAKEICKHWENYTHLSLEDASYNRMWIRDVNNYVAEDMKGNLKQKGAYWHPDPNNYVESISEAQPPAWHKDLGNVISIRAAVMAMVHNINPDHFIRLHTDKFDFMLRAKVDKSTKLMLGNREIQKTSRYYVSTNGEMLKKISPPPAGYRLGDWKRKSKITDGEYRSILATLAPGQHDERIHTKNKSKYENRITMFEAGYKTSECNNADDFRFDNINYDYYVNEARKLII